jgi:Domain of unknown function (DUF4349)
MSTRRLRLPHLSLPVLLVAAIGIAIVAAFLVVPPAERDAGTPERPSVDVQRVPADGGSGGGTEQGTAEDSMASRAHVGDTFETGGAVAREAAPAPDGAGSRQAPALAVKVIQTASLRVRVRRGGVEGAVAAASRSARAAGGYVVSTSMQAEGRAPRSAAMVLRVPSARFEATLARLREQGSVREIDVSSQDVTEEYVDVRSRLRHDRAVEARLLTLLAEAKDVGEALAVQARLDGVQEQVEVEQGRLNYLERLTDLSTVELTLEDRGASAGEADDDRFEWGLADALRGGAERFTGNVNAAIVALGGMLPGLLLAAVGLLVARRAVARRRDERARAAGDVGSGTGA